LTPQTIEKIKFNDLANWSKKQKYAANMLKHHDYLLYGGAMGGGKSYFLRWILIKLLLQWYAETNKTRIVVGMFCEDYPALKDRHLSKIGAEFPEWLGSLHADHKEYGKSFILAPEYGSGVIVFRNLDDPSKYQSAEFAAIAVDELTKNDKNVFDFLRTRKRWPGIAHTKFIAGTNPGGIGHNWVKKLWMDKVYEPTEKEKNQFYFVQALAYDNPLLDENYFNSLSGLPERLRKAYLEGDWSIFAGQYFTEFNSVHHVRFKKLAKDSTYLISLDYGYAAPSSVGFWEIDQQHHAHRFDELYVTNQAYDSLAYLIKDKLTRWNYKFDYIVADPAIFGDKAKHRHSLGGEAGNETIESIVGISVIRADNRRVVGWSRMRVYLQNNMISVHPRCKEFIRTIPTLIHDEKKPEDVDTDCEDHVGDETRYLLFSRPEPPEIYKRQGYKVGQDVHMNVSRDNRMQELVKENIELGLKKQYGMPDTIDTVAGKEW